MLRRFLSGKTQARLDGLRVDEALMKLLSCETNMVSEEDADAGYLLGMRGNCPFLRQNQPNAHTGIQYG